VRVNVTYSKETFLVADRGILFVSNNSKVKTESLRVLSLLGHQRCSAVLAACFSIGKREENFVRYASSLIIRSLSSNAEIYNYNPRKHATLAFGYILLLVA
jgi:hypothetical protein